MQCVAVCYSVLQCVTVYYSALQCVAVCYMKSLIRGKLTIATAPERRFGEIDHYLRHGGGLHTCVAVCCSVLQCVAVCCSVLQCVAVCCSVLQCVAVCCSESLVRGKLMPISANKEGCTRVL